MKILGICGSPHRKFGNTYKMMEKVFEGAKKEGMETELIMLPDLNIEYCSGCAMCLREGKCPIKDDVSMVHEKMRNADGIILGSPVYILHVTAQMKTFLDRCLQFAHRPQLFGKFGASVSVYAGVGDVNLVSDYMNTVLRGWGVTPIGKICAYGVKPGEIEKNILEKCFNLGIDIAKTIKGELEIEEEKENFLKFKKEMRSLILKERNFMRADYKYWKEKGWLR